MQEMTPQEFDKQAEQIAQQLFAMTEEERVIQLRNLTDQDRVLATLIRRKLHQFRSQARGGQGYV